MTHSPGPDPQQQVTDLLATDSASTTMPADVVQRVHTALAHEAALRAGEVAELASHRPTSSTATAAGSRRWLVAASVAAIAVLAPAVLVAVVNPGGDDLVSGSGPVTDSLQREDAAEADGQAAGAGEQSSPDSAGSEAFVPGATALPAVPSELLMLLDNPAAEPAPPGCGSQLADEIGGQVSRAVVADTGTGVLVAAQEQSGQAVWWLPSCEALSLDALGRSEVG